MKILICPDSYKGTLTAPEAARAIAAGVVSARPEVEVELLPVGDGGEGTAEAVASVLTDISWISCRTLDPLHRPVTARYAVKGGKTALIESAAASGLTLVSPEERDIMKADTYGTGLLIADAYHRGISDFIICLGGTATCDGGYGAYLALKELTDTKEFYKDTKFTLLTDVGNPLCGPQGAAAVFGPQKGATPDQIPLLDKRLREIAGEYAVINGIDVSNLKYAGAAGGLAGMLMACFNAMPLQGIDKVLEMLEFEKRLSDTDLVITGEGRADATTLNGKAAIGILNTVKTHNIPVALIAGAVSDRELLLKAGFKYVEQATPSERPPSISAAEYLTMAAARLAKTL